MSPLETAHSLIDVLGPQNHGMPLGAVTPIPSIARRQSIAGLGYDCDDYRFGAVSCTTDRQGLEGATRGYGGGGQAGQVTAPVAATGDVPPGD
jgi:hypothetical protein